MNLIHIIKVISLGNLIKKIFETAAESAGAKAVVGMELQIKCYSISEGSDSVKLAIRALKSEGLKPEIKIICGGTDAANYNEKGIETVVIGMGVQDEHTKAEKIAVSDMMKGVRIIQQILKDLCGR